MKRSAIGQLYIWKDSQNRLPLVVKGARQVGKTHLIREFGARAFPNVHEFNFETQRTLGSIFAADRDLDVTRILTELSFASGSRIDRTDLIFFDEIQECPHALTSLKYFAEKLPHQAVIAAGSLLGVTLTGSSFPVGKVAYQWIGPFSFHEFLSGIGDDLGVEALEQARIKRQISAVAHAHLWERLKAFYVTGGMPKAIEAYGTQAPRSVPDALTAVRKVQEGLVRDYQSDFSKHTGRTNAMHIRAIFNNIPHQLNASDFGNSPKFKFSGVIPGKSTGYAQLQNPIEWLERAGLIYRVKIAHGATHPLSSRTKDNQFKLFPFDVGICGALAQLPPERIVAEDYGTARGYFAENIALQGLVLDDMHIPYAWSEGDAEIEFLTVQHGEIVPVEVKSGRHTKAKSLASFIKRYAPKAAVKLYNGPPAYDPKQRLHVLPLYVAWDLGSMELF